MSDPITFVSTSPRYELPLLFAGQSQKEFFVNEAHARLDALLHPAVEGETNDPPASPAEGECWLVADAPTGAWEGHAGSLACWSANDWLFIAPRAGMRLYDLLSGQMRLYRGGAWSIAEPPTVPSGGTMVDAEARAAIAGLRAALAAAGIVPG